MQNDKNSSHLSQRRKELRTDRLLNNIDYIFTVFTGTPEGPNRKISIPSTKKTEELLVDRTFLLGSVGRLLSNALLSTLLLFGIPLSQVYLLSLRDRLSIGVSGSVDSLWSVVYLRFGELTGIVYGDTRYNIYKHKGSFKYIILDQGLYQHISTLQKPSTNPVYSKYDNILFRDSTERGKWYTPVSYFRGRHFVSPSGVICGLDDHDTRT